MSELREQDLQCKNHVNISDHLGKDVLGVGFSQYGKIGDAYIWLIHFPKLLFHQFICPDNPKYHEISLKNWGLYNPNWYKESIKEVMRVHEQMQLTIQKTKIETLG
jgi:hypothetical protein